MAEFVIVVYRRIFYCGRDTPVRARLMARLKFRSGNAIDAQLVANQMNCNVIQRFGIGKKLNK
jgi:hypothetical protein